METKQENRGNPWNRLPLWSRWTLGIVGAILLIVIGAAIGSRNEGNLKAERDEAQQEIAEAENQRDRAVALFDSIRGRQEAIVAKAKQQAAHIVDSARSESDELSSKLDGLRSTISSREDELSKVESSLEGAREEKAKSTIPGNGTFQAEVDYLPGTYESQGGEGCYWATLNSADPFDIASNENASGQTIASIHSPYFQTKGCGTWKRIGE
jgi:hypothetical protein